MSTSTLPEYRIPGEYVYSHYGTDEPRLRDGDLYGRSTENDRREMLNRLNLAAQVSPEGYHAQALREARTESRIAYAYVMGIFDTFKHVLSTTQFETFLNAAWVFSDEVQFASYMFHAQLASGKYGYTAAWGIFLRYNPQVDAILGRVTVAARPL